MSFIFDDSELLRQLLKVEGHSIKKKAQQATDPQSLAILQLAKKLSLNLKNTLEPGSVNVSPISLSSGAAIDVKPENLRSLLDFLNWATKNGVMWNGNKVVSNNEADIPNAWLFEGNERKDDKGNPIEPDKYYVDKTNLVNLLSYLRDSEETKNNKVLEVMLGKIIDNTNQYLQPKEQISKQPQEKPQASGKPGEAGQPGEPGQTAPGAGGISGTGVPGDPNTLRYLATDLPFNSNDISFDRITRWVNRYAQYQPQVQSSVATILRIIQDAKMHYNAPGNSIPTGNLTYDTISMTSDSPRQFADNLWSVVYYTGTLYQTFFSENGDAIMAIKPDGENLYRAAQQQISGASPYADNIRVINQLRAEIRENIAKNTRR